MNMIAVVLRAIVLSPIFKAKNFGFYRCAGNFGNESIAYFVIIKTYAVHDDSWSNCY